MRAGDGEQRTLGRRVTATRSFRRGIVRLLAVAGMLLGLLPIGLADAAGPGVLDVDVTILDESGTPITVVNPATTGTYVVNVAYSCSTADCENTIVTIDPTPLDPYYAAYRKEASYSFTPPYTPAPSISGNLNTGLTIDLGTVGSGVSGSFRISYLVDGSSNGYTAGASFFPSGSSIDPFVTIESDTATAPVSDTANATFENEVPDPNVIVDAPSRTRTDEPIEVSTFLSHSGCVRRLNGVWLGRPAFLCAASYDVTIELPTNAQYVSGGGTGTYDGGTHSVNYSDSGNSAAVASALYPGNWPITVSFPSGSYPTTDPGCVASEQFAVTYTITYLDGTVKSENGSTEVEVQNCEPFAQASMDKLSYGPGAYTATEFPIPLVSGDTETFKWQVRAQNRSNVAGIATIVDDDLDHPDMPVTVIRVLDGHPATVDYTLDDTTVGSFSATDNSEWTAPAGRRVVAATATSSSLVGPNTYPTDNATTSFRVRFEGEIAYGATPASHTNTATGTMSYPDYPALPDVDLGPVERTVDLVIDTDVTASAHNITPQLGSPATTPVVGTPVTWSTRGQYQNVSPGAPLRPQQIFLAPIGWDIDSAAYDTGAPAGVTYTYLDVVYDGETHSAVVAEWPGPIGEAGNVLLPVLYVETTPTINATAGTNTQRAHVFIGDVENVPFAHYSPSKHIDTGDIDGDGSLVDEFARRGTTTSLAPTLAMGVTKEICRPDPSEADGCDWISDPNTVVGVPPTATSIAYRVTIENQGNDTLNDVVAYDVLPYVGDTGTTTATAGTPRGSTVQEQLATATSTDPDVTLAFSTSTNPPRPEVYSGSTTGDWTAPEPAAAAIRATIPTLPAFESRTFTYEASLVGGSANQVACNSVALTATSLTAIEPSPVCAATQEADFSISSADRFALQVDRPGIVPFVVNQGGGSPAAYGEVTIDVPAGYTVGDLTSIGDWTCTTPTSTGPTMVTCTPDDGTGTPRELPVDVPETIELPVTPDASTASTTGCFDGAVEGRLHDPEPTNDTTTTCSSVVAASNAMSVSKDDGVDLVAVGDQISYTVSVANLLVGETISGATLVDTLPDDVTFVSATGNPTVAAGTLTWNLDDLAPAGSATGSGDVASGAPGSTQTFTVTVDVAASAEGTITNFAEATALDPSDSSPIDADDDDVNTVQDAAITLTKQSDRGTVTSVGQMVTYGFEITNTGNVGLTDVTLSDPMVGLSAITCDSGPMPLTLGVGDTEACSATYEAASADFEAGTITNVASVSGQPPLGQPVSTTATATVTATPAPHLTISKGADETDYDAVGDVLHFTFTVLNDGNVDVTGLIVGDELPGTSPVVCASTALASGASTSCSATYSVTAGDLDAGSVTNTATATATAATGPVTSQPAAVTVDAAIEPSISITKLASEQSFAAAHTVLHYSFVVTNTGNVTLDGIAVDDALPGLSAIDCPSSLLPAGGDMTCTATYATLQADVDSGGVSNTATVSADPPSGPRVTSTPSSVTVPALAAPAISLVKSVDVTQLTEGQVATYTFEVHNTGNTTVTAIAITDPLSGLSAIDCPTTTLMPNLSTTCTATYTITQTDIDDLVQLVNTATVSGEPPTGPPVESNPASAAIPPVILPELTIVKTAEESTYDGVGDTLHFDFAVTNTGNVTLNDIVVNDPLVGLSTLVCDTDSLGPDATTDCTATYAVTQADLDTGSMMNIATVSGSLADDSTTTSDPSRIDVEATQLAAAEFTKSASIDDFDRAGVEIVYSLEVRNTGNVTISGVDVTDPLPGLSAVSCPASTVAPSASVTCTATYSTTTDDLEDGGVTNTAGLTATTPAGDLQRTATAEVDAIQNRDLQLDKTVVEQSFTAGTTLHFRFAVTNDGNVTVDGLTINDPMDGLSAVSCPVTMLAPGETTTCEATYVATAADVSAGRIVNTATASGDSGAFAVESASDTAELAAVVPTPPPPTTPPTTTPPPTPPPTPTPWLPQTGSDIGSTLTLSALALAVGAALVGASRRRRFSC